MEKQLCWICYDEESTETLIRACQCKGSMEVVHESCLFQWIEVSLKQECTVCHHKYEIVQQYDHPYCEYIASPYFEHAGSIGLFLLYFLFMLIVFNCIVPSPSKHPSSMHLRFLKCECIVVMMFAILFLFHKMSFNIQHRWLSSLCDHFKEQWELFYLQLQETNYSWVLLSHDFSLFSLGYVVYKTFLHFLRSIKKEWINLSKKLMPYKEETSL
jgi:hypothetical protein